jgi:hypothetical protein
MSKLRQEKLVLGDDGDLKPVAWEVNLVAAGRAQKWSREDPALLEQEVGEMQTYFPSWLLTATRDEKPLVCGSCREMLVWKPQGLVCAACDSAFKGNLKQAKLNLAWVGHIPAPLPQNGPLLERLRANPDPAVPVVKANDQGYLLVPILAYYPEMWPKCPPVVRYDRVFLNHLGITQTGHITHLVGRDGATLCLYASWRAVTLRVVLQQRVVNHIVSLFKVVQGVPAHEAFLEQFERY